LPDNKGNTQKQAVKLVNRSYSGGRVKKDAEGKEVFVIPVQKPKPSKLEECWAPRRTQAATRRDF